MGLDFNPVSALGGLNPMSAVSGLVKEVVSSILPGPLGKLAGDVAAGVVDYETGNFPGLIQDGLGALNDLPQAVQALRSPNAPPAASDPPPPPGVATGPATEARSGPGHFNTAAPPTALTASAPTTTTVGSPSGAPANGASTMLLKLLDPLGLFSGILGGSSLLSGRAGAATGAGGASSVDQSTLSKDDFMKLGNEAFMQAVRDGKIPKEVQDSPAAMQSLQARMNSISSMNQLMTSMLQALHQMEMSIIQNVRV